MTTDLDLLEPAPMLQLLASAEGAVDKDFPLTPVGFGLLAMGVLLLTLYVVTRFDPDR